MAGRRASAGWWAVAAVAAACDGGGGKGTVDTDELRQPETDDSDAAPLPDTGPATETDGRESGSGASDSDALEDSDADTLVVETAAAESAPGRVDSVDSQGHSGGLIDSVDSVVVHDTVTAPVDSLVDTLGAESGVDGESTPQDSAGPPPGDSFDGSACYVDSGLWQDYQLLGLCCALWYAECIAQQDSGQDSWGCEWICNG